MKTDSLALQADRDARRQALAVDRSFIVQAPAGSGKTELLIQRILALLAVVNAPEEILAITFTRKAAAEMRKRLLDALERAESEEPPVEGHAVETWERARQVLSRDRERGWGLREHPARLQVMTIDSLCAALVRRMPYLSRFGEMPAIVDEAGELYREAAERLCSRLEGGGAESAALQQLLAHLDTRLPLLRDLLAGMLGRRDQWLRHLNALSGDTARIALEGALAGYVAQCLGEAVRALGPVRLAEAFSLGRWAAANLAAEGDEGNPLAALLECGAPPGGEPADLPAWQAIASLLLTSQDQLRNPRGVTVRLGFSADKVEPAPAMKRRIVALLEDLGETPACVERLQALRKLPGHHYAESQWVVLAALVELLPLAVMELRAVFRQRGEIDFAEIARGALTALGDDLAPTELLLQLDGRLRHLLVDEFQDTSRAQYDLLAALTAGWERGDGRTLFLVGDPMQSIYRFREAEVGLYLHARAHGIGSIALEPLVLSANFRSQAGLVEWCNRVFAKLFPAAEDSVRGAVPFSASAPSREALPGPAVTTCCFVPGSDTDEADAVVALIRQARERHPEGTVAVLVRARSHLSSLVPALKAAGLRYQAREIDPLSKRPAIQDLLALTRALLHPADRVAWLTVLRAPWCGLTLADLLALVADRPEATLLECLAEAFAPQQLFAELSVEGRQRLERVGPLLAGAVHRKGRVPLRRLVESTWLSLGGPAGLTVSDLTDTEEFLSLLDELDDGGDLVRLEGLEERLAGLFAAPDSKAGPELQLMTIHKAKGLEFDTVILPGLGKKGAQGEPSLLLWQEDPDHGLLLAPIPPSGVDQPEPTYQSLVGIHRDKERLETLRLLYVAATRAKCTLHLLGHAPAGPDGGPGIPPAGSLLRAAWEGVVAELAYFPVVAPGVSLAVKRPGLRRLPAAWMAPALASTLSLTLPGSRRASGGGVEEARRFSLVLRSEEGRIVGTCAHLWLERIATDGLEHWSLERVAELAPQLAARLAGEGVPAARLAPCVDRVVTALQTTLSSRRGRWILDGHAAAACELALTGILDGSLVHAVIDRTFVDEDGVRWVIDYKTGALLEGETLEEFLDREEAQYREQLQVYLALLNKHFPEERKRQGALYFPLLDAWREIG